MFHDANLLIKIRVKLFFIIFCAKNHFQRAEFFAFFNHFFYCSLAITFAAVLLW